MKCLGVPAAAFAAAAMILGAVPGAAGASGGGHRAVAPPMRLPAVGAPVRAAATGGGWLVGARPTARSRRVATAMGARALRADGVFAVAPERAPALAAALRRRGLLSYAEPDVVLRPMSAPDGAPTAWARGAVVAPTLAAPAPGAASIAVIDDFVDPSVADVAAQTRYLTPFTGVVHDPHGTEVASVAAGAANGTGVLGIFPGAPLLSYHPAKLSCSAISNGILAAAAAHARVINISIGGSVPCFTMQQAIAVAYAEGSLVVAAAGNDGDAGDPLIFPAAFPHVLSVASVNNALAPSAFSESNAAIDLAAPGEQVPVALPVRFDTEDGAADGVTVADGTSFAAPIVSGAAAWVATVRPSLSVGLLADVLRFSATDLAPAGRDERTGFGLVTVGRALAEPTPREDALEPNDDIAYVDGRVFTRAAPLVWRGGRRLVLKAGVDAAEDPADVYRVRLPARSAARIALKPAFGRPALRVFSTAGRTVYGRRGRIATGSGRSEQRVVVANRRGRAAVAYVAVLGTGRGSINSDYRLAVARA
jgi:hypothetical protein